MVLPSMRILDPANQRTKVCLAFLCKKNYFLSLKNIRVLLFLSFGTPKNEKRQINFLKEIL